MKPTPKATAPPAQTDLLERLRAKAQRFEDDLNHEAARLLQDCIAAFEALEPRAPVLRVAFHRPVASKKNSKELRHGKRPDGTPYTYTGRSSKAKKDEESLALVALAAARAARWKQLEDEEVELRIVWNVGAGLELEVRSLGPRPKAKRTGRARDAVGMLETIADALEGVAYRNDRQVARVVLERRVDS